MNDSEKMRILLSAMPRLGTVLERNTSKGETFKCVAHHFEGAGLLEISCEGNAPSLRRVFRLSMTGEPIGIFDHGGSQDDRLIFDLVAGYGDQEWANSETESLLTKLDEILTEGEKMAYYL